METLVKEKILEQFVKEIPRESATIQPINVDIKSTDVTRMISFRTMKSNDGNYFIRYGGDLTAGSYNAIEIYSVDSLDNNAAIYIFDNLQIENHTFFIRQMKQSEDGRFYAVARYNDGLRSTNYLIIFNNFIQDGYCQINKYYTASNIGTSDSIFYDVAKVKDSGVYFISTDSHLIRFEINILEGNKTNIATIVNGGTITSGTFQSQLNVLGNDLIFTKLWYEDVTPSGQTPYTKYEYTKAVVNINGDFPNTITLNQIYTTNITIENQIRGAINQPFEVIIPYLVTGFNPGFVRVRIDGTVVSVVDRETQILNKVDPFFYTQEGFAAVSNNGQLYLFYFKEDNTQMYNFYTTTFTKYFSQYEVIKQYDMITLIGSATLGTQQSIVSIKNIYSPNTTSLPYYTDMFCLPAYMNLYSDSNDNTSLIFSRDATARFYSGNQVTSTFIVPNYLLNDGNIEKASVYGKTNYLLNDTIEDYEKNRFESLYFNFIYNLNVIDNTNGLNVFNQIGSNRIADTLWKSFIPMLSRLSKARITYEDLSAEIIRLNLVSLIGGTATFNYQVSGNIVKIEYLSEDEKTVYSTYRGQITGNHTITQVVKIIPNGTATLSGTSIYIRDSSNLTFANIQINGNSVQDGTPTSTNLVLIKNAGDAKNLYYLPDAGTSNGITYSINEDGTINLSGTATANATFPIFKSIAEAQIENGATYTFSSNQALPSGVEFRAEAYNNSSWLRHLIGGVINSSVSSRTGTANLSNATRIRHLIYIGSGTTVNITNLGIQFEKGSTQTSFTPEGKGFINEKISNKNLFNKSTILEKHLIDSSGNIVSDNYNFVSDYIGIVNNMQFVISASTNKAKRIGYYDNSKSFISRAVISNYSGQLTIPTNAVFCRLSCHNDDLSTLQLEVGESASTYIEHQEQVFTLPCQQAMRSIGNVRDEFIKQDGLWYEKHTIGVIENYNGETITTDFISTTGSLSTGAFVQYVLNEPNYIECTQEQIQALESIIRAYTYEPITNINSTDETPAYLNITYYKQL